MYITIIVKASALRRWPDGFSASAVFRFIQYAADFSSLHAWTAAIITGISAITASTAKKIAIISIFISPYFPSLAVTGVLFLFSMTVV